jgi:hypothetical protein
MIHGSTKALHTKSLYKAQSTRITRILGLPNEAGETLTGTQKHGHIVHPMQKSCEPTVPTRDNRGPSLMDLDPSLLIGCRASTALHLRQKHCLVV